MVLSIAANNLLETTYDKYANIMFRVALSHLGIREDAEDAVHDVFVSFAKSKPKFTDGSHEKAWFIRSTINRCHDLNRRKKLRTHISIDEIGEIAAPDTESDISHIISLVTALPERYKSVIILHYLEEYSVKETAAMLGISESATKMRLARGRDILKEKIEKEVY